MYAARWFVCAAWLIGSGTWARSEEGIRHGFLASGGQTYLVGADGKTTWELGESTRDGWVLENGNYLFALSKGPKYPGGGVREITKDGKTVFDYKGTQSEVNTVQALPGNKYLVGEAGARPRLLEIDGQGKNFGRGSPTGPNQGSPPSNPDVPQAAQRQLPGAATAGPCGARVYPGWENRLGGENSPYAVHRHSVTQWQHPDRLHLG